MPNLRARELRWNMTDGERKLWSLLRRKKLSGFRFRRQATIGPYIADFFCPKARLIVELDGEPHSDEARMRRDAARDWMDSLKEGQPCADCGAIFAPFIMHWDHLPGHLKVDEIGSMISSARRARILEEVAKCELVCANCHVMRTVRRARRTISEEAREYRTEGTSAA